MWEWLLFDLDNTLMDFDKASKAAFALTMSDAGIHDRTSFLEVYHKVNKIAWEAYERGDLHIDDLPQKRAEDFVKESGLSDMSAGEFNQTYLDHLASENHFIPGVEAMLDHFSDKGQKMAIVTNGLSYVQRKRWQETSLSVYFEDIFIGQEIGRPKPYRFFFDVVHGKLGRPNRQKVLIVGDNAYSDIEGGRQYGYRTCWYNRNAENRPEVKADFTISNMVEVIDILP
jgi:2-haloacid dehalogenase